MGQITECVNVDGNKPVERIVDVKDRKNCWNILLRCLLVYKWT